MAVKITYKYHISDFEDITNAGFLCNLSQETLDLVSSLAEQVGAPSYIKTPIFPKKESRGVHGGNTSVVGNTGNFSKKNRNKAMEINDEDWEAIRNFQTTQKHISEGIEKNIDNIRSLLNKITENNFDEMEQQIKKDISFLIENDSNNESENINKIGHFIFNIASSNSFYSSLYARLFKSLMNDFPIFKKIFEDNFKEFMNLFNHIEFVDPKKNYDKFCEYTKNNDKRRAMSLFLVNLMINNVLQKEEIIDIINQIQKMIKEYIKSNDKANEVEELSENLYILITKSISYLKEEQSKDDWENIKQNIELISCLKPKAKGYPSISNKIIFKHMDILEECNNQ